MDKILFINFIVIGFIKSSIIPVQFNYKNGKMTFEVEKSKEIIECFLSTQIKKNYIPIYINENSRSKRRHSHIDFYEYMEKLYDDWFFLDKNGFIMKYYTSPEMKSCIISLSKDLTSDESLVGSLYNHKKINNAKFGIIFDEKNKNSGILYLGGLPLEEKKGLYNYSYKYSLIQRILGGKKWYITSLSAQIKTKSNTETFYFPSEEIIYLSFKQKKY